MKAWNKKLPKLKKGAWFVPVRGSYLPMTPQAWLLHLLLSSSSIAVIAEAFKDKRSATTVVISLILELIGLGAVFTYIASKKAWVKARVLWLIVYFWTKPLMLYNSDMKKKLVYFVTSLSLVFALGAPLAAQAEGQTVTSNSTTTTTDSSSTDDSAGRPSRLEAEKKNLKEALTEAIKTRIAGRCVAAQAIVKGKLKNNGVISTTRTSLYDDVVTNLQALVTAAKAKNVDVTELQTEITTLQAKIASFKAVNTTYQQALADLSALDCKTDPTAFKAALEAARADQLAVFNSAKDIRTYLNDTVKVTLKALKTKLDS